MNELPPGPRGAIFQTLRYAWNPWSILRDCRSRYGDPFTVPSIFGPVVLTGTPAGAKEILGASEDTFDGFGMQSVGAILGKTSLMLVGGDDHRRMRRLYAPAFRLQRVRGFDKHILDALEVVTAPLQRGTTFSALELSRSVSLEVIVRAVFGGTDAAKSAHVRELLREMVDSISPWLLFIPALQNSRIGFGPWARHRRATQVLEQYIRDESSWRRDNPTDDVLTQLLLAKDDQGRSMTEDELRDQLVTLLLAGYDTSAFSLAWALYRVYENRNVLARLRDELANLSVSEDPAAIMRLPYLDAVVNETLRMYPLGSDILRTTVRPFVLRGHEIPAGMGVAISATLLHEDPEVYPRPFDFDPDRFLTRTYSPHEYVPFGGGHFRCVGAGLATREMKLTIAWIVSKFDIELESNRPVKPVRKHFLTGPDSSIDMRVIAHRQT